MQLIALKNFSPDGFRYLKKGESFEISASSARLLIATHRAKVVVTVTDSESPDPQASRRTYKRRDMNAEK